MARLIAAHDWTASGWGHPEAWPAKLRVVVELMLCSATAKFLVWGPELRMVYNDAYLDILGNKHPSALGKGMADVWAELWPQVSQFVARVQTGESFYVDNAPFMLERHGQAELAWISFSYAPLYLDGKVEGFLCELFETTHRIREEEARKAEHQRFEALFDQSPAMIAVVRGRDYVFAYANKKYQHFMGQRPLIGVRAADALPELIEQGFIGLLDEVYLQGRIYRAESVPISVVNAQNETERRFVSFVYQPVYDASGRIDGVLAEGFDVTDVARASAELRESEQRLRQLANVIPQLAWKADRQGKLHWYNERWYAYTGTDYARMCADGWQHLVHADYRPVVLERWRLSVDTGAPFEMTFPLRGADGAYRHFYTLVEALRNESGEIVQWFGTNTDVSKLHEAQEELKKTEEWLEAGLAAGRMVVWEWDFASGDAKYSENSTQVLGYGNGEMEAGWASIHPDDAAGLRSLVDRAIETQGSFSAVTRRIRPDSGQPLWVETKGRVMCDAAGQPIGMRGIMIDQTARHTAELDLKESNRRKDEFLAMLAHELRNPLAPISSAAQLLALAGKGQPAIARPSEVISRQVQHMSALIDDLLDVSRVTRGLVALASDAVDLAAVARNAVEQIRPLMQSRQHSLTVTLPDSPVTIVGDATRMTQVIANILNNAAKYSPQGGVIALTVAADETQARITVRDNGSGIDADLLPRIFELFSQATRTPDRSQGGLGLGLALVKSIVALHHGSVTAASDGPGQGATIEITVPLSRRAQVSGADDGVPPQAGRAKRIGLQIVIVDDNADAADLLAALLTSLGHHPVVFYDAEAALNALQSTTADVFVLDIGLPTLDGYELARRIRDSERHAGALLIALTGYGQSHDRTLALSAGYDYHLVKPLDFAKLQAILQK